MKNILILTAFYSILISKDIKVNDVIEADEDYQEKLKSKGIKFEEYTEEKTLLEQYNDNRDIVDDLKADDLKILCKTFEIEYTKVDEARESLKKVTV